MTIEEVAEFARLVSQQLENNAPWRIPDQDGNVIDTITKRELLAMTMGLNAISVFSTMETPKLLNEYTIGELAETAKRLMDSYANMLGEFGLLQPQGPAPEDEGEGDGKEA
jgi:hypothetical protein